MALLIIHVFQTKIFTIFHALRPSFNHFIVWSPISLQLHTNSNKFFLCGELECVLYAAGNSDDLYGQIIYRTNAHFFLHLSIHRILFRKFNPQLTSSESSSFHPLFLSLSFYLRPTFDYISMFLSVEIFIMIKYS